DGLLGQTVLSARRVLDDTGKEQHCIRTVFRFGYHWVAATEAIEEAREAAVEPPAPEPRPPAEDPPPAEDTPGAAPATPPARRRLGRAAAIVAAALALGALGALLWF